MHNANKPRVAVLGTGGTIAGAASSSTHTTQYQSAALSANQLLATVPALGELAQITTQQVASIDSKDATPQFWQSLQAEVVNALKSHDAVIITHGTDTLEETALFLDLTVPRGKPIVITAAMRPSTSLSADGPLNLLNAMRVAVDPASANRGVLVAINNQIHSAQDVTKVQTARVDAFDSPNMGPIGAVQDNQVLYFEQAMSQTSTLLDPHRLVNVQIVYCAAGVDESVVDYWCQRDVKALVIAGTGNGSISTPLEHKLAQAASNGVAVIRSSRVGSGYVNRNGACNDEANGFESAGWLNPQKARVYWMLKLGNKH